MTQPVTTTNAPEKNATTPLTPAKKKLPITANQVTVLRIFLLPFPCWALLARPDDPIMWTAFVFGALVGATDFVDGCTAAAAAAAVPNCFAIVSATALAFASASAASTLCGGSGRDESSRLSVSTSSEAALSRTRAQSVAAERTACGTSEASSTVARSELAAPGLASRRAMHSA